MTYDELKHFIESEMRMSQIYQPLMLMELIESGGISGRESIAKRLLEHDPSQVSYYENIVDRMPGKVLKGHSVVTKDRTSQTYHLTLTEQLSDRQKADLLALCHQRKASKPCKAVRCCTLSLRYWPPVPRWNYLNEFLS